MVSISKTFRLSSSIKICYSAWHMERIFFHIYYSWSQLITITLSALIAFLHSQIYLKQKQKKRISLKILNICALIGQLVRNKAIFCAPCTRLDFFSLSLLFPLTGFHTLFFQFCSRLMLFAAFMSRLWWNNAAQHSTAQERSWRRGKKLLELKEEA